MRVSLDGGETWADVDEVRVFLDLEGEGDEALSFGTNQLSINCTHEGVVMDRISDGETFETFAQTYDELTQNLPWQKENE